MQFKTKTILILFLAILCLSGCSQYTIYHVKNRPSRDLEGGIFYALPKTKIRVEVTFERTAFEVAPYAPYAEKYLAISVDTNKVWNIVSTKISAVAEPDPENYYYVELGNSDVSLQVAKNGVLKSVNSNFTPEPDENQSPAEFVENINLSEFLYNSSNYNVYEHTDTFLIRTETNEDKVVYTHTIDEKTLEQRAQETAHLIEELRLKKKEIMFGEYESSYNGESLKFVYDRLSDEEKKLMQLFTGLKTTYTEVFYVEPESSKIVVDDQTVELFRYTAKEGIVDSTNQDAKIVYCNLRCDNNLRSVSRYAKGKMKKYRSSQKTKFSNFRYRIPETVTVSFITPNFTTQKVLKVSQYGTVTDLPKGDYEALFDVNTGELLYIKKK